MAILERCQKHYGLDQAEWFTLTCSQVSDDHFGVNFVQFGGEMKHKMPQEGGHSSSLSREEDEQSSSKRHRFGIFQFSPSISDFLIKPPIDFKLSILFNFALDKLQF